MKKVVPVKTLWLVRHAEAVDGTVFPGDDLDRPLTPAGRRITTRAFRFLAASRPAPDIIISSQAVRAVQTADLLAKVFTRAVRLETEKINPGCRLRDVRQVAGVALEKYNHVALVGHEPDFSRAAARLIGARADALTLKKSGVIELELNRDETWRLIMLLPPDVVSG